MEYKKGAKKTVADTVSGVETTGETKGSTDEEMPGFCVEYGDDRVNVELWSVSDPHCHIDEDIVDDEDLFD